MVNRLWILLCLLLTNYAVIAQNLPRQNGDTSAIRDGRLVAGYVKDINSKADRLDQKLDKYTAKVLRKAQKNEAGIKRKLAKTDSLKAIAVFGNADEQYKQLEQRLANVNSIQQYIPAYDTALTALKFLQQNQQLAAITKESGKLKETLLKVNGLGSKLGKAEEIKKFIKSRKEYLKNQLQNLGFAKQLKKLSKQTFFAAQQLNEYKAMLKDHRKAERKIIELMSREKIFQNFFRKNSLLASLFRMPGDPDDPVDPASLAGLQTRIQVNSLIQQQIGTNGQTQFQKNMQDAQSQLQQLKDKVMKAGNNSSDEEISEGFKKNNQRVKSFWKKWEIGINAQSNKPNSFFPVTTDLSMMAGFKPHDGYVVGVGIGGLIGWGKDIRHIDISSQGMSIKSFAEIKIKGSFHFAAGYEMNYRSEIRNIEQLKKYSAWSRSGLAGISKIVSIKSKFFKKTKLSLMWDFLSYSQIPKVNQPIVFRIGYSLR